MKKILILFFLPLIYCCSTDEPLKEEFSGLAEYIVSGEGRLKYVTYLDAGGNLITVIPDGPAFELAFMVDKGSKLSLKTEFDFTPDQFPNREINLTIAYNHHMVNYTTCINSENQVCQVSGLAFEIK